MIFQYQFLSNDYAGQINIDLAVKYVVLVDKEFPVPIFSHFLSIFLFCPIFKQKPSVFLFLSW